MEENKSYREAESWADTIIKTYENHSESFVNYDSMLFKSIGKLFEFLLKITQIQEERIKNLEKRIAELTDKPL